MLPFCEDVSRGGGADVARGPLCPLTNLNFYFALPPLVFLKICYNDLAMTTLEDFKKLDLRIGKIIYARTIAVYIADIASPP